METARAWKLGVGLATLILVALMAAILVARGTVGYADWPSSSAPPAADEIVTVDGAPQPAETAPVTVTTTTEATPAVTTASQPSTTAGSQGARQAQDEVLAEEEAQPERAETEKPEEVSEDSPAELAPETPVEPATDDVTEGDTPPAQPAPQLARPDDEMSAEGTVPPDDTSASDLEISPDEG
jgi:hypothetical protein